MVGAKKPILGLCGAIGAGKSSVAKEFEIAGCRVIDSDALSHEVLRTPDVITTLVSWWGPTVSTADGTPDRRRIAAIVFADGAQKQRLEGLVHPLIAARRADMIRQAIEDSAVKAIILDSPLLFESNLDRLCDAIIFVDASEARRLERLRAARGWDARQLRQRQRWQRSPAEKRLRSNFVIDNNGPPEQLRPQVVEILKKIGLPSTS